MKQKQQDKDTKHGELTSGRFPKPSIVPVIALCLTLLVALSACASNSTSGSDSGNENASKNPSKNISFDYKNAVGYQIYPKSFQDSNNDGVGDLKGITSRLDYLDNLGVNLLWLCPVFASPMVDNGYDISDYLSIDPTFGTMEDMEELIAQAKERNMGIMLDLVMNHTSDQHQWFQEALKDPNSKYRDYYYFREGDGNGNPPTNWRSVFGGSVWEPVPGEENMYYFHSFAPQQPDLNWGCAEMRQEINNIVAFWMNKGVVGFRVDAINFVKKAAFENHTADGPDGLVSCFAYTRNVEGIDEYYRYMKDIFDSNNCVTIAEAVGVPYNQLDTYIGDSGTFTMLFDFSYTNIDVENEDYFRKTDWTVKEYGDLIITSQESLQNVGWSAPFLENHDQPRSVNKLISDPSFYTEGAKALAVMNLLLRGTPFVYQGEELGTLNFQRTSIDQFDDVNAKSQYDQAIANGFTSDQALQFLNERSRDNARTPFAWTSQRYGGFSTVSPWIAMSYEHPTRNATDEAANSDSVLNFYQEVIAFRKANAGVFSEGNFTGVQLDDNLVAYQRSNGNQVFTVVVNLSNQNVSVAGDFGTCVLNTHASYDGTLQPYQAVVLQK